MLASTNKFAWSYDDIIFPVGFASQRVLDKDPLVWLDGARPPKACLQVYKKYALDEKQQSGCWLWLKDPSYMINHNNFENNIFAFQS